MEHNLENFTKYCLGYVKLTRQRGLAAQQKYAVNLPSEYCGLVGLLNGDTDGSPGELINLETFYSYDPKRVPEAEREKYEREKALANKIEDIYNKYRNDQFRKQIVFSFGYFEVELPLLTEEEGFDLDEEQEAEQTFPGVKIDRFPLFSLQVKEEEAQQTLPRVKIDHYPLFSLQVKIEKEFHKGVGRYVLYLVDPEVQVNIGMLEPLLGQDLYYQIVEEMGRYEIDGKLTLPIVEPDIFVEIWHKVKAQLKLRDVSFDEDSYHLYEMRVALSPRVNYFLAEDLQKLSQLSEQELAGTALTSWVRDDELNIESEPPPQTDLYFPFLYDRYQLRTLSAINNKAAIVQGPPGTGKSETIANLLCHLAGTRKRVLFVSQKAQALKVVKDKLKKLEVKYLFGYLPNPASAQVGEEDEVDGIAPQLTGLNSHMEKLSYASHAERKPAGSKETKKSSSHSPVAEAVIAKTALQGKLTALVEGQRKYYGLAQELKELKAYDFAIPDIPCFEQSFSVSQWKNIKKTQDLIDSLSHSVHRYEDAKEKSDLDKRFAMLNLHDKRYADATKIIRDDVAKRGYDGHSDFWRQVNNTLRKVRLGETRSQLPREIRDYIDEKLRGGISRNEAERVLESVHNHCHYYENVQDLAAAKNALQVKLGACGISDKEYQLIDGLTSKAELSEVEGIKLNILRAQEIKQELRQLERAPHPNQISHKVKAAEKSRSERVALYLQHIIDDNLLRKWKDSVTIRQITAKLARAFGKSRRAFKTFDNLRKDPNNFNAILDLIPIWVMELDDASRIIPLEASIFDYVILDEASQCNVAYTLPVMFRGKKVLFVGDSEQMRDNTIMFKSNKAFDELAHRYQIPAELQIKATGAAVQSVLDIATMRGLYAIPLRYHYRSPAELIGFSNKYFYIPKGKELIPLNSNYLTYGDTNRIMVIHERETDWSEEFSDHVNVAEAKAILKLFRELRGDNRYKDKSIGILSFFNAQATYIRRLFEEEGYKEEEDDYKVGIIEGIQGDEKDIILYSFVIRQPGQKNKYIPLTGEGGDVRADINRGRVNVAFSRAKLQTHCFVSLPISQMPEKIWLKKYLEYMKDRGEVDFYSTELKPFDSHFEEEFYSRARVKLKRGYTIQNQVESCGFRIDFVISNTSNGNRIAVECDGPTHFRDEIDEAYGIYVENDEERQRVLIAAGWEFYRIKYSDWINENFDKEGLISEITELLK